MKETETVFRPISLVKVRSEFAKRKLADQGFYDEKTGKYNFGNADGHALRVLYILALGLEDVDPVDLRDKIRIENSETPPWKE